jgi:transposase
MPAEITTVHLLQDNLRVHKGKVASAWLAEHPHFVVHYPPVHCSWLNQVEQWFSLLQRKALSVENFASLDDLAKHLLAWIAHWNEHAHPFDWTTKSVARVMARCAAIEEAAAEATAAAEAAATSDAA